MAVQPRTSEAPAKAPLGSRLQQGIYFKGRKEKEGKKREKEEKETEESKHGGRPRPSYRLLLLDIKTDDRGKAGAAIALIWRMLEQLKARDLAPDVPADSRIPSPDAGELSCLLGFGARLFDRYKDIPKPTDLSLPDGGLFRQFRKVATNRHKGGADLALQFIGRTELAVNRAVAEVWMLILLESLPLQIVEVYGGFNREDRRSWLGFHDGISNLKHEDRPAVITVTSPGPAWMEGGTYMAFLRMAIDLEKWRRLPLEHQEFIVGRDKATGVPLGEDEGLSRDRKAAARCPVFGDWDSEEKKKYIDPAPPHAIGELLRVSHMYRANPNRGLSESDNRIFRQGYEFLEQLPDGRLRLGVNFVSYQADIARVKQILTLGGWLGNVNFGGYPDQRNGAPAPLSLVELIAGGFYAVPPKAAGGEVFPAARLF